MALTPQQVANARNRGQTADFRLWEAKIDAWLCQAPPTPDGKIYVNTEGCPPSTLEGLKSRYRRCGWSVDATSDRDGPCLVFKAKSSVR